MRYLFVWTAIVAFALTAPACEAYRVGVQPDAKKKPADDPRMIIEDLKADYQDVRDQLGKSDPGEQTRAKQKRILDGLRKLLEQPESPPPPRTPSAVSELTRRPVASLKEIPQPPRSIGAEASPVGEQKKKVQESGGWNPSLPARERPGVDAIPKERFMPRYEELLRAYYRTIAEVGRHKDQE